MTDLTQASSVEPVGVEPLPAVRLSRSDTWSLETPVDWRRASAFCEDIAFGKTMTEIELQPGMPPGSLFIKWVLLEPRLQQMFLAAREVSSYGMEDECIALARQLVADPKNATHVRAVEVLIGQLKWSATKRNPGVFSDKASVQVTVPIQINTSLDLGKQGESQGTSQFPNIYALRSEVVTEVDIDPKTNNVRPRRVRRGETPVEREAREKAEKIEQDKRELRRAEQRKRNRDRMNAINARKRAEKAAKQADKSGEPDAS
jgi:hypothetical protein